MSQLALPPELLPRVLDYADPSTLATCLRLSHDSLTLTAKRLYRHLSYDPNIHPSFLLNLDGPLSLKRTFLDYIACLTLHRHEKSTHSSSPLNLPNLKTLRLVLEPWEASSLLCWTHRPPLCPHLTDLRPTTLIIGNLYSLTTSHPKGLGSPISPHLPTFFDDVHTLVLKPTRFVTRFDAYTRLTPLFVEHLPSHIREVAVIFETIPSETWPRWYQEPNEEWLPSDTRLAEVIKDLADVVCPGEGVSGRKYVFVNAGRIDSEFLGMGKVGVVEMERKVEEALRAEVRDRMMRRAVERIQEGVGGEDGGHEKDKTRGRVDEVMGMVRFAKVEDWVGKGVLEPAVQRIWDNPMETNPPGQ